jgi:succinate dehydrogenase / fumarate reductase cytochrome b subunit
MVFYDGHAYEDMYGEMKYVFSHLWVVVLYVLGCFSLFWHLLHGFQSAFQSLGLNHTRYKGAIALFGDAFSVVISTLFAAMPLAMYFKWIS